MYEGLEGVKMSSRSGFTWFGSVDGVIFWVKFEVKIDLEDEQTRKEV